jgi:hypothetical protein
MPDTSLADKLKRWQTCISAMAARLEEIPHLKDEHSELSAVLQGIEAFLVEEELHNANLRATIRKRRELER